jgi:hypothetical protein
MQLSSAIEGITIKPPPLYSYAFSIGFFLLYQMMNGIVTTHHADTCHSFADSLPCSQLWSCQEIPEIHKPVSFIS